MAKLLRVIILFILFVNLKICEAGLRAIGGRNALKDEFPFAVRLEYQLPTTINSTKHFQYIQFCTGTAITLSWILTAAHCHRENIKSEIGQFARYNSFFPKELGRLSPLTKVYVHPGYKNTESSSGGTERMMYDFALYQTENLIISSYGKIIAIDYSAFIGHETFALGFGITNATSEDEPLQVLKGILIKCDERLTEGLIGVLCIVPRCGLQATLCPGDSGGPVVHASGIVGVTSIGYTHCKLSSDGLLYLIPGAPSAVIAMISPVVDWISNIVANNTDIQ